jgi:hypothetical protein
MGVSEQKRLNTTAVKDRVIIVQLSTFSRITLLSGILVFFYR